MRFMHLADLHIGRKLDRYFLSEDQIDILNQIVTIAHEQHVDAVLIAGDLYDKDQPSESASSICSAFLTSLYELGIPVIASAGNHDSATRISFLSELLSTLNIKIAKPFSGEVERVDVEDEFGPLHIYLFPYLTPAIVRKHFPEAEIETFDDALRAAVDSIELNENERNIAIVHQFVLGRTDAIRSESEGLFIGGTDEVSASMFERFDYVALGHLHAPQWVVKGKIRYAGSPLKYSFSEVNQKKNVTVIELGPKGTIDFETYDLNPLHGMRDVKGTIAQLREYAESNPDCQGDFVRATLTQTDINARAKLEDIFPLLTSVRIENESDSGRISNTESTIDITKADPIDVFSQLFEQMHGRQMDEDELAIMKGIALEVAEGGAAR